ncbi:MAG TPA: histidine kinase dimerization/phospho-acceptor domain-containing protein, partial [Solirubrobacterales bacterium]
MASGGTRASRLRPGGWPVRWRIAATSAGLTLAILLIFGGIIGKVATERIRSDFNREVKSAVTTLASQVQIVDTITNTLIIHEPRLSDFASPNDASVRIFDSNGAQLDASPGAAELGPPAPGIHTVGDMRVATVTLTSGQTGRIAGYVQYGRNDGYVDSTINHLWLFIAAGVLGGTLLASLAGVAIAGRAMRPISSLTTIARRIAETGDPSRRMPEPKADDEVGELTHTLEQMLRSLDAAKADRETAMKKQREFVADASHELRTPLTSVLANLELLQASLDGPGHEEERAMIGSALRSSTRMSRLVADLLLLARADAGRGSAHSRCDLAELVGAAAAEVAPTTGDRHLRVENGQPLPLDGNADELHRMVLNLLDNAVRHTPPGSTIELR